MTNSPADAKSIFGKALEITAPDERVRYLDEACRGNAELRSEVDGLLQAHQAASGFLAKPAAGPELGATLPSISEGPGAQIGRYKLLQQIGEGGFGTVFMAEQQEPVRRMVALKVIKPGMDSRAVVARFEAERQALALMDHPNIARVFDGGVTDSGRPYFVMELVKGVPITAFCDKNNSTTEERLRLFVDVCRAVQHAHQKGVIHRDLKPSNIMVTLHDGVPVAKVIDFGVAKALSQRLTEKTLFTAYGQMIGTPLYMSPEQAEMSGLDVDTRSDIYSLGVLLYELLTGCTPLEAAVLRDAGYAEMQRLIRETEPPRPSVRLSTSGERLTEIAQHRSIDAKGLRRLVAGELDWIVMKALEKDRRRRYETATAFATDVERFLRKEAVEAGPPTAAYRLRKFVARRKALFATMAAVAATLMVGLVGTATGWLSANRAREDAEEQRNRAQALAEQRRRERYVSDMNAALLAWNENNVSEFERLLTRYIPRDEDEDLRTFDWYHLWKLSQSSRRARRTKLPDIGHRVVLLPGTRFLAVAHSGPYVTLWDTDSGEARGQFGHVEASGFRDTFLAVSPDGRTLACRSPDSKRVLLHNRITGEQSELSSDKSAVCFAAAEFSPDGGSLVTSESGGTITLWDMASRTRRRDFSLGKPHSTNLTLGNPAVTISADGTLLAAGGSDGRVKVWDLLSGQLRWEHQQFGVVRSLRFSPRDRFLACTGMDQKIWIRQLETGDLYALDGHRESCNCVAFSPDEAFLLSGGVDRTIRLWNPATRTLLRTLKGHWGSVRDVAFLTPKGQGGWTFASVSLDQTMRVWDLEEGDTTDGANLLRLRDDNIFGESVQIGFAPDEQSVATLSENVVRFWNHAALEQLPGEIRSDNELLSLAVSCSGLLAVGRADGAVDLFDWHSRQLRRSLPGHTGRVQSLEFSADGTWLAAGTHLGEVKLWSADTGILRKTLTGRRREVSDLSFSSDASIVASTGLNEVVVWSLPDGERRTIVGDRLGNNADRISVSPDGQLLAVGSVFAGLLLWDLTNLQLDPQVFKVPTRSVVFSADGKTLFAGGQPSGISVWDIPSRQLRCILPSFPRFRVGDLALSRDQRTLAAGDQYGQVAIWHTATDKDVHADLRRVLEDETASLTR